MARAPRSSVGLTLFFLLCFYHSTCGSAVAQATFSTATKDPTAVAVIQQMMSAMGGALAPTIADSEAQGTVTFASSGSVMPVVLKSKGHNMCRSELQKPMGTTVRIVNAGAGIILRPDGSAKRLAMSNTLQERVSHIPVLSLLAEFQNSNVSVENGGATTLASSAVQVVTLRSNPFANAAQADLDKAVSKTQFFVDMTSGLLKKVSYNEFAENNPQSSSKVEVLYSDYRSVNGVMVPFHQTTYYDGQLESDLVLSTVAFNVGLPDSDFALPQ